MSYLYPYYPYYYPSRYHSPDLDIILITPIILTITPMNMKVLSEDQD